MKRILSTTMFLVACIATFCLFAGQTMAAPAAETAKQIQWRLASTWTEGNSLLDVDRAFAERVKNYTGGNFIINVHPAGQLGSSSQVFDLAANGIVEAACDWPGYWAGKNTAFDLLASTVDNFSFIDYYVWTYSAGGLEQYQYVYGKYGLVAFPIAFSPSESGLRCIKDFKSLNDLKNAKVRISGKLQGYVAQRIGFTPVTINAAEIYESLQRGVIDAAEFAGPEADESLKMHEVAKYWMTPGWHQSAVTNCVMVNKKAWEALPEEYRDAIARAAKDSTAEWLYRKLWVDVQSSNRMIDKFGVTVNQLSEEDLRAISRYAADGNKIMSDENPDYKRVYESMQGYRKEIDRYRGILGRYGFGFLER
ncbi:ABC transporter substrate-binding protein [Deltaproteobacteria bacterium]|nr:ABC transporter substrate-binding protein [Deltaproteobacteria bacterium]